MALIRVGSRGSRLALTQAELAGEAIRTAAESPVEIALVPITTTGDRDRTRPFGEIGSRGVFVKELEEALLARRIDVAVHSAKDMTSSDACHVRNCSASPATIASAAAASRRREPSDSATTASRSSMS